MGKKANVKPLELDIASLKEHITCIARAAGNLSGFDKQNTEKAKKLLELLESTNTSMQYICISEALELAASVILRVTSPVSQYSALAQKEENRKEGKKIRDEQLKAEGREKVRKALLKLEEENKPVTTLSLRWEINQLFGDAGQRSVGNLMLPDPDYHMSLATIKRRLREMPGVAEDIFGITK